MFITYIRSSSYNDFSDCQHLYYLRYCLGLYSESNFKAVLGTVYHKIVELLANKHFASQEGRLTFEDDGLGLINAKHITPEVALLLAYDFYSKSEPQWDWDREKDLKMLRGWADVILNDSSYNPLLANKIISPERKFDFAILKDWARYSYIIKGKTVEGHLGIKGTSDLVRELRPGVLEVVDYKTGKSREDWKTGVVKDFDEFMEDPQLMLYYYAMCHEYPDADEIIMTIYWVRDGGPFTLPYSKDRLPEIEQMIRSRFEEIRDSYRPSLKKQTKNKWKCRFCYFEKTQQPGTGLSQCDFFRNEVRKNGVNKTFDAYGDQSKLSTYQDGGGRKTK